MRLSKAISTFPGLKVENGYVASQTFDAEMAAQKALGWTLGHGYDAGTNALHVTFTDAGGRPVKVATLSVLVGRTTEAVDDVTPAFVLADGIYTASATLGKGKWMMLVTATAADGTLFQQRVNLYVTRWHDRDTASPVRRLPRLRRDARGGRGAGTLSSHLMLPTATAHCAACISTVEAALLAVPGVRSARVNLTQKRVTVDAGADVTAGDAALMLSFLLLLGRYLDHRSRALARSAAEKLTTLEVPRAVVLVDGVLVDGVLVDGVLVDGVEVDRGLLTGESLPVLAGPGTLVSAGEVNLTGPLTLRVTAAGRVSSLRRMAELVAVAERAKTRYTTLAERAARLYSPWVHLVSFSTLGSGRDGPAAICALPSTSRRRC